MTEPDWARTEELFARLVELDPVAREELLQQECVADPELRARLDSLLAADADRRDRAVEVIAAAWSALEGADLTAASGQRFGAWVVGDLLGEGGMSEVYLAARADQEFNKRVAFKLLKAGLESAELVRRFKTERRILASLEHPNIARLIDAGTTADGRPYFVMELVAGEPLDRYCDQHRLGLDQRLRLFLAVCSAVSHAHHNLIVHRDLKPSNILVSAEGVAKLLDFGIAQLLNPDLVASDEQTARRPLLALTPAYASPEQLAGQPATTAGDVYSLGLVLSELLCGKRPQPGAGDPQPRLPSALLRRSTATDLATAATDRGTTPRRLMTRLQGDLDAIVLGALRPEPQRRFSSVELLAADIERYLVSRPVEVRGGGMGYRLGKWIRRHPLGATATFASILLGSALIVALSVLSLRLSHQRDESARQLVRAERTADFLVDLFESPGSAAEVDQVTARQLLDRTAERVAGNWSGDPIERAALMETIARVYRHLGLLDQATPLLEETIALRREILGADDPEVAAGLHDLGIVKARRASYREAEALFREALEIRRQRLEPEHPDLARSINNLALVLDEQGEYAAAEPLYREALAITERGTGRDDPAVTLFLNNLALVLISLGSFEEAESLCRRALERLRRQGELEGVLAQRISVDLGSAIGAQGRFEEADRYLSGASSALEEQLGADDPEVARAMQRRAELYRDRDPALAAQLLRRVLDSRLARLGDSHPELAPVRIALAATRSATGRGVAARDLLELALADYRRAGLEGHPGAADALVLLARLDLGMTDAGPAVERLQKALAIRQRVLPAGDWRIAEVEELLSSARGRVTSGAD